MTNVALNTSAGIRSNSTTNSAYSVYTIRSGDTLGSIAARHGVSVEQLLQANPQIRNPNMIYVGDRINVPLGNSYTVQAGDTLGQIAARYGTSVDAISTANGVVNPNLIYPGDTLVIPGAQPAQVTGTANDAAAPQAYEVRAGDTLGGIAARFGVSTTVLAQTNNIHNPNLIFPGDTLVIPNGIDVASGNNNGQVTSGANGADADTPASVTPGQLPDTEGLTEAQKFDLYAGYINEFGSDAAQQQLANGQKVALSLRVDTSTHVNQGRGQYDDRMVLVWQGADGTKYVREYSANLDPSGQYEHRGEFERKPMGVDYNRDGRLDQGRLADGTYQYTRGTFMNDDAFLSSNDQVAQRDVNHNGRFDDNATSPRGNYGMHIHIGGNNNTYSAGCFTLAPESHAAFFNSIGGQSSLTNVVVNTSRLTPSEAPIVSESPTPAVTESGLPANSDPAHRAMTEADFQRAANELGVDVAVIKAVADVEAAGSGFLADGRPKILFEAHWFGEFTGDQYNASHPDISSARWNRSLYVGGSGEYSRLERAMALNDEAALKSASWGKFQIMGFNHQAAGYSNVKDFVHDMFQSEGKQLDAFVNFIESNPAMHQALQRHDWATFAYHYNGSGYAANNYDVKLAQAYARHSQ